MFLSSTVVFKQWICDIFSLLAKLNLHIFVSITDIQIDLEVWNIIVFFVFLVLDGHLKINFKLILFGLHAVGSYPCLQEHKLILMYLNWWFGLSYFDIV